jgi:hypothetical protein
MGKVVAFVAWEDLALTGVGEPHDMSDEIADQRARVCGGPANSPGSLLELDVLQLRTRGRSRLRAA